MGLGTQYDSPDRRVGASVRGIPSRGAPPRLFAAQTMEQIAARTGMVGVGEEGEKGSVPEESVALDHRNGDLVIDRRGTHVGEVGWNDCVASRNRSGLAAQRNKVTGHSEP